MMNELDLEVSENKVAVTLICDLHGEYKGHQANFKGLAVIAHKFKTKCPSCAKEKSEREDFAKGYAAEVENKEQKRLMGIPKVYSSVDISSLKTQFKNQATEIAFDYAVNFNADTSDNIILTGKIRCGKTTLICGILNELAKNKVSSLYVNAFTLFADFNQTRKFSNELNETQVLDKYSTPNLLVIDEFGMFELSDEQKYHLHQVINGRFENMVPTIIVSNNKYDDVLSDLGNRAKDRLQRIKKIINVEMKG